MPFLEIRQFNKHRAVFFFPGDSRASEFYVPTFRGTVPSSLGDVSRKTFQTKYEDGTECSETSEHKIHMSGYHTKERTQYSEHGEILKSKNTKLYDDVCIMYFYPVAVFTHRRQIALCPKLCHLKGKDVKWLC